MNEYGALVKTERWKSAPGPFYSPQTPQGLTTDWTNEELPQSESKD
jgi:hypothetical protein